MPDPERERLELLIAEATGLCIRLRRHRDTTCAAVVLIDAVARWKRRSQHRANLDALVALDAETGEDIMREVYP